MNNHYHPLTNLNTEQKHFFMSFFGNAPQHLIDQIIFKTYPQHHRLIDTGEISAFVYILLAGRLQALEERGSSGNDTFTEISSIEIVGDFELFTSRPKRLITLITLEQSDFLIIPAADYLDWIKSDTAALFIRTQMLIRQLTAQNRFERQNFLLDNKSRLLHFLLDQFQKRKDLSVPLKILLTRPQLSDKIGCSIRTINRIISQLQQQNLIHMNHGKIQVNQDQYNQIKQLV